MIKFCVDIIFKEVEKVLFLIGDDKVFGIDGFNVYFFQKGKILKVINCIVVILIIKYDNVNIVSEFIFIVCCSVLYKIIFKIIIYRFQIVIEDLISNN